LDEGEEKAIILAVEQKGDLLLIDDLAGRRAAQLHGINVMGTLGFLKVMHKKGRIQNLKSVLDALQKQGFWMREELYRRMLEE
jgi:predicted nucleic acid-binding protein